MYSAREGVPAKQSLGIFTGPRMLGGTVPKTVVLLGLTSLFTDISSEMVSAVLPLYAIFFLQLSPLAFGLIDGIYQGAASLVRIAGGVAADRWNRHKDVAATGYALSAVAKLGLLLAGPAFWVFSAALLVDRSGKGIRTGPRDALISLSTPAPKLARAFAVHRALDTLGALTGPIVAFALLTVAPGRFDAIFVVSFCVALLGLGVIVLFVENRPAPPVRPSGLWSGERFREVLRARAFPTLLVAAGGLALCTVSDGFLYLALQRRIGFSAGIFPLLYVVTSVVYFALAIPAGRLADRFGRVPVLIAGYALLPIVYLAVLAPDLGYPLGLAALLLFGAYYAATDGVLAALASSLLPSSVRATGLSVLSTAVALARLVASVVFGAIWTFGGVELAVGTFAISVLAVGALSAVALRRVEVRPVAA